MHLKAAFRQPPEAQANSFRFFKRLAMYRPVSAPSTPQRFGIIPLHPSKKRSAGKV
jgi:hypothetical protein